MRGLIFASTWERGIGVLKAIIKIKSHCNVNCIRTVKTKQKTYAEFDDGSRWDVVGCSDHIRGRKWHECYVDRYFSQDMVDNIVKPCAFPSYSPYFDSSTPLERRIHYF